MTIGELKRKAKLLGFEVFRNKRDQWGYGGLYKFYLTGDATGGGYCYCNTILYAIKYLNDVALLRSIQA